MSQLQGALPTQDLQFQIDNVTGVLTVDLSPTFSDELREVVQDIEMPAPDLEHSYVTRLRRTGYRFVPADLLRLIESVRSGIYAPTAIVFNGLPFDPVVSAPGPTERPHDRKPSNLSENVLVMFASLFGEPYSLAGEGTKLVNDLVPTVEDRVRLTGNGSERRLGFHTENAAHRRLFLDHDLSPHALLLEGVVAPSDRPPRTLVANGRIAAARLNAHDREILSGPCVEIALPLRQRRGTHTMRTAPTPLLTGSPGVETVTAAYYGDMMRPVSKRAKKAVDAFEAALEAVAAGLTIKPGVLAYIPNTYTLHAREAFTPEFDPQGRASRWLQRVFLTTRLDGFQIGKAHGERVFELPE